MICAQNQSTLSARSNPVVLDWIPFFFYQSRCFLLFSKCQTNVPEISYKARLATTEDQQKFTSGTSQDLLSILTREKQNHNEKQK